MNKNLLEEIKRFRQISNLENKKLINEGRGETLWKILLSPGDITAAAERKAMLLKMMNTERLTLSKGASDAKELTAKTRAIADIESLISRGAGLTDVINKIKEVFGDKFGQLEKNLEDYVDATVRENMTRDLSSPSSTTRQSIIDDFNEEIDKRMQESIAKGDSPLVRKYLLDLLKKEFADTYKKLLEMTEEGQGKIIDEILEGPYKAKVKELSPKIGDDLTFAQSFMKTLRNSPLLIDDIAEILNLAYLTITKSKEELMTEIENLVLQLERGSVQDKNAGKLVADRIKVLLYKIKSFNDGCNQAYITLYDEIINKIKNAIPDEKERLSILSKIEEFEGRIEKQDESGKIVSSTPKEKVNGLRLFFENIELGANATPIEKWKSELAKIKEFFTFFKNPFGTTVKDYFGKIVSASSGWAVRWWNYAITGSLSTFKEYVDKMAKKRRSLINKVTFGKVGNSYVSGYGWQSIFDMYLRIWLTSNVYIPLVINIFLSIFGWVWACNLNTIGDDEKEIGFGIKVGGKDSVFNLVEDNTYKRYCQTPFKTLVQNQIRDMGDTFTLFMPSFYDKSFSIGEYIYEFADMVIPFNTQLDSMIKFYFFGDPTDKAKKEADKKNEKEKKEGEKELEEINPKLKLKKEAEVVSAKEGISGWYVLKSEPEIYEIKADSIANLIETDLLSDNTKPMFTYGGKTYHVSRNMKGWKISRDDDGYEYNLTEFIDQNMGGPGVKNESIIKKITNMILENNSGKKFGDDNFKHWKDTFTFKAIDEKNPGQYKEVKINMEDVMDRINHYRKKYDEDDAFVRAVIDTHEDVIKVMFTKDLAHLQETHKPLGLALILQQISESRGEMEIWSVARPANGNWFLVKGDYTPKQMVTMDLQKNEPRNKETKVVTRAEDDLKKKEISAIQKLKNDEKSGLEELPIKVREKVKEKISRGWTTEVPFETFDVYYKKSEINSAFNEKIKIYKLIPSNEFFNSLIKNSSRIRTKRGFCKSISNITNEFKMTESQQKIADHILNTCNRMYGNQKLKKYKPVNQND